MNNIPFRRGFVHKFAIVTMVEMVEKKDEEWKLTLNPQQVKVLRQCGTEPPFSGKYVHHKENGVYVCAGCGNELFSSDTKFESGSGWPSFWEKLSEESVDLKPDNSYGMRRGEDAGAREFFLKK
jgi:peptide-methionine (R)-S-oxide reductase